MCIVLLPNRYNVEDTLPYLKLDPDLLNPIPSILPPKSPSTSSVVARTFLGSSDRWPRVPRSGSRWGYRLAAHPDVPYKRAATHFLMAVSSCWVATAYRSFSWSFQNGFGINGRFCKFHTHTHTHNTHTHTCSITSPDNFSYNETINYPFQNWFMVAYYTQP